MATKRPLVFIGSSTEGLPAAKAIQLNLDHTAECVIWHQGGFGLSEGNLESLVKKLDDFDFAILVLTPDDFVESRGDRNTVPRDNVLLELGLFIGSLGRERTFMVCDRQAKLKLPSDLAGITPATFQPPESGPMQAALGAASTRIEEAIGSIGRRKQGAVAIDVVASVSQLRGGGSGLSFTITNRDLKTIPPFRLCLYHPKHGRFYLFPSEESGSLLPDQRREHNFNVYDWERSGWIPRFSLDRTGEPLTDDEWKEFEFRLELEHSDKVLYSNNTIGQRLARVLEAVRETKTFLRVSSQDLFEMRSLHLPE